MKAAAGSIQPRAAGARIKHSLFTFSTSGALSKFLGVGAYMCIWQEYLIRTISRHAGENRSGGEACPKQRCGAVLSLPRGEFGSVARLAAKSLSARRLDAKISHSNTSAATSPTLPPFKISSVEAEPKLCRLSIRELIWKVAINIVDQIQFCWCFPGGLQQKKPHKTKALLIKCVMCL